MPAPPAVAPAFPTAPLSRPSGSADAGKKRRGIVAALLVLVLAGGGAAAYAIGNHPGASPSRRTVSASAARGPALSAQADAAASSGAATTKSPEFSIGAARRDIVGLLDTYQSAYSQQSTADLAGILSPSVTRHGLAAGGCTVSHGLRAVLADYRDQFQAGTGTYKLIGLSEQAIAFDGTAAARIKAHYEITPGGSGFVDFKFAEAGQGWKISEIYATCS